MFNLYIGMGLFLWLPEKKEHVKRLSDNFLSIQNEIGGNGGPVGASV